MSLTWNISLSALGWLAGWIVFGAPVRLGDSSAARSKPTATRRRARSDDLSERSTRLPARDLPKLSVVVPARNEEATLPLLLGDIERHAPSQIEVIVVNDDSEDCTASVAAAFPHVVLLDAGDRPPGWLGKPWACHIGATQARAPALCFIDADVRLAAHALETVGEELTRYGGLVSVQPYHQTERPYEQGSALFGTVALMGAGTGDVHRRPFAFGPVLACSRADYERVGGHEAVGSEVVEDIALARRFGEHGLPVRVEVGGRLVRFRMYPGGIRSMFEGWVKSFASGAASTSKLRLAMVVLWLAAMGTAFGLAWDALASGEAVWAGVMAYFLFAAQLRVMFARVGSFGWITAALFPVLLGCFFVVFFRSLWCTAVRKEVRWRGRLVPIASPTVSGD